MKGMRSLILFESKFYVLHKVFFKGPSLNYVSVFLPVLTIDQLHKYPCYHF